MFSNAVVNTMLDGVVTTYGDMSIGLTTTMPYLSSGSIVGVTEPSGGGYARASLPVASWGPAVNRAKPTDTAVTFPGPTGTWGFIVAIVVYDTSSGLPIFYGPLSSGVSIDVSVDAPRIVAGAISLALPAVE
jgi:hypothetical protein